MKIYEINISLKNIITITYTSNFLMIITIEIYISK